MGEAGCQLMTPRPQPPPRLGISTTDIGTPIIPASQSAMNTTYTVTRGTLRDAITLPGKVAPARAAELRFPNGRGTVSSINVRAGDAATAGTLLAQLRLGDAELLLDAHRAEGGRLRVHGVGAHGGKVGRSAGPPQAPCGDRADDRHAMD